MLVRYSLSLIHDLLQSNNMKMKSVAGIIYLVKDLDEVTEFYKKLGFTFRKEVPGVAVTAYLNWFWIEFLLETRVVTEAFKPDVGVEPRGTGQSVHISVDDVDAYYEDLIDKGLKPFSEPADFSWGNREFVLVDPNGYKLVFFTKIK